MNIATINVRGINNPIKRKTIFHWLENKKFDIICLQETFCTQNSLEKITNDWDGLSYHCTSPSSHAKGVSILFNKNLDFNIISIHYCNEGRKLLINFEHKDQSYTIVNLYAPTDQTPRKNFLKQSQVWIQNFSINMNCLIVCGDLNCSFAEIDRKVQNIDRSRETLKQFIRFLNLKDTFRSLHKNKVSYTYSNSLGTIQSRIDYILCSQYLDNILTKCYHTNAPKIPDHKLVGASFKEGIEIGKNYWKMNVNLLNDERYVEHIVKIIESTKAEFSEHLNKRDLWDICKVRVKEESIYWAISAKQKTEHDKKMIQSEIDKIDTLINNISDLDSLSNLKKERDSLKNDHDVLCQNEAIGAQIRSRAKYINEGERNTKYFLNLENKRQTNNRINSIIKNDGNEVFKSNEILKEGRSFYSKLYENKNIPHDNVKYFIDNVFLPKRLDDIEAAMCEGEIREEECLHVIKHLRKNISPGLDGLPNEFYVTLWQYIKDLVIDSFNEGFLHGELSDTHKQIILSLIFKKNDRKFFKNYRPISLSNTDYKILAFVLANRLQKILHKIISPEQVAYIKERYIGQNIRLVLDVIDDSKKVDTNYVLLFLDFEKAFDSLNWDFIHLSLSAFGFGNNFCHWIKSIYTKPQAFLKINGFLSERFSINRGIRQGCPLSCLIFIIATEFMTQVIQQNDKIKGIPLNENATIKITQYADDTCLFLYDKYQIKECIDTVKSFSSVSGLMLNLNKTEAICLCRNTNCQPDIKNIMWSKSYIRYLGIYIGHDKIACDNLNWTSKLEKFQKLIDSWRLRKLTLFGKITIIKSLALPKLLYSISMLPTPSYLIKQVNKILFNFLWGKVDRIKRSVLINDYDKGGCKMIDIESYVMSMKCSWLNRIYKNSNLLWTKCPLKYFGQMSLHILGQMDAYNDTNLFNIQSIPEFYREAVISFLKVNKRKEIISKSDLYSSILWGNRQLTVRGKPLYDKYFIASRYIYVRDILDDNGNFRDIIHENLVNRSTYLRTISMLMSALKHFRAIRFSNETYDFIQHENLLCGKANSKKYYNLFRKQKCSDSNALDKLNRTFINDYFLWKLVYSLKIRNQFEMSISEFNYKLVYSLLPTKSNLFKWKKSDNPTCIYCNELQDSLHLLYYCEHLDNLWILISNIISFQIEAHHIICCNEISDTKNKIISLISYIIYKKYLIDKENNLVLPINDYVKSELIYKNSLYIKCEYNNHDIICEIINSL